MNFTARFARDAECAERKYISFSAERAERERFYALKEGKFKVEHLKTCDSIEMPVFRKTGSYCFPSSQRKTIKK